MTNIFQMHYESFANAASAKQVGRPVSGEMVDIGSFAQLSADDSQTRDEFLIIRRPSSKRKNNQRRKEIQN